jgi:hypothetical protein
MGTAMAIPPPPRIPREPIPFHVDGIIEIQRSAQLWARLAVLASVLTGAIFLFLAWNGLVPWLLAIPFFLAPLLPIGGRPRNRCGTSCCAPSMTKKDAEPIPVGAALQRFFRATDSNRLGRWRE